MMVTIEPQQVDGVEVAHERRGDDVTVWLYFRDIAVHLARSEAEKLAGELNSILPEPGTTPA